MTSSTRKTHSCSQIPWSFVLLSIRLSKLRLSFEFIHEHTFESIRVDRRQELGEATIITITTPVSFLIWSTRFARSSTYPELGVVSMR
jgi:hypothetical protein